MAIRVDEFNKEVKINEDTSRQRETWTTLIIKGSGRESQGRKLRRNTCKLDNMKCRGGKEGSVFNQHAIGFCLLLQRESKNDFISTT